MDSHLEFALPFICDFAVHIFDCDLMELLILL